MSEEKRSRLEEWQELYAVKDSMTPEQKAKQLTLLTAISEFAGKFGEENIVVLDLVRPVGETAIFRAPDPPQYQRFTAAIIGDKGDAKARAAEVMARNCVVFPDRNTFGAWCDRYPAIGSGVLKSLTRLAGGEAVERGKD
jgi:hypothetical protein